MGGGYPCGCCKCKLCSTGHDAVMHVTAALTNDQCVGTPGCAIIDDTYVMTRVKNADLDWLYDPPSLVYGTKGCKWVYAFPDLIECSTSDCEACDCTLNHPEEGFECDPLAPGDPCNDPGFPTTIVPGLTCAACDADVRCTVDHVDHAITYAPLYCGCVADVTSTTGFRCDCDGSCITATECVESDFFVHVWLYPIDDGTGAIDPLQVGLHVEVLFEGGEYTHDAVLTAVDGKADCSADFTNYTATLTQEVGPVGVVFCDPITEVILDLV